MKKMTHNNPIYTFICFAICLFGAATHASEAEWQQALDKARQSVVSIRVDAVRAFDTESFSSSQATGFVVDARRGLILTNRHVVQPGPVIAKAVFANSEEVDLTPVYRDPVHDFGFYRYDPKQLKFIKPESLPLAPYQAKVGLEVKVIGNDSGEHMSILSGTLARLDRNAPKYRPGGYNDFNTFYFQSAADTSGGSSGSPVINQRGEVVALNAGGKFASAASYFMPLYAVQKALKKLQQEQPITRGTLQITLRARPYDEVRRLGLSNQAETGFRKHRQGDSLLVVEQVLPSGPADGKLRPGDILLSIKSDSQELEWLNRFEELEFFLDRHVNQSVQLTFERQGRRLTEQLQVADLHAITPSEFIEVGGAILHPLSYQLARQVNMPLRGIYVANAGYLLSRAGIGRASVITEINGQSVVNLDKLQHILTTLMQNERIRIRYFNLQDPRNERLSSVSFISTWHLARRCHRDDRLGYWPCENLNLKQQPVEIASTPLKFPKYKNKIVRKIAPSLVRVEATAPYYVDGNNYSSYTGTGVIVDAERGLVVVDRNTVPVNLLDVKLIFADTVEVPATIKFVHPLHNLALLQYDVNLLNGDRVQSARLLNKPVDEGDKLWLVGLGQQNKLVAQQVDVRSVSPLLLPRPRVPSFMESNVETIRVANPPSLAGGVLLDKRGRVRALWTNYQSQNQSATIDRGIPIRLVSELLDKWNEDQTPIYPSLEIELTPITFAEARALGLEDKWLKKFQNDSSDGKIFKIKNRGVDADAYHKLRNGDLLLTIDGVLLDSFARYDALMKPQAMRLEVFRDNQVLSLTVEPNILRGDIHPTYYLWAGAMLQDPHRALAAQFNVERIGAYISWYWYGSPANRYRLLPLNRIIEVDGVSVNNVQGFIDALQQLRNNEYVRLRLLDLFNREKIITLEPNEHYWPTAKIFWDGSQWRYVMLSDEGQ